MQRNSTVGQFTPPAIQQQQGTSINGINSQQAKVPVYHTDPTKVSVLDTRFFGSNVATNIEGKGYISESLTACTDNKFAEISSSNSVNVSAEKTQAITELNLLSKDDIAVSATSFHNSYVSVFGRSLDFMANDPTNGQLKEMQPFGLPGTFSITIPTSVIKDGFTIPVLPTYGTLSMNTLFCTYGPNEQTTSNFGKLRGLLPWCSFTFNFLTSIEMVSNVTITTHSKRISQAVLSNAISCKLSDNVTDGDLDYVSAANPYIATRVLGSQIEETGFRESFYKHSKKYRTSIVNPSKYDQILTSSIHYENAKVITIPHGLDSDAVITFSAQEVFTSQNRIPSTDFIYNGGEKVYCIHPLYVKVGETTYSPVNQNLYIEDSSMFTKPLKTLLSEEVVFDIKKTNTSLVRFEIISGTDKLSFFAMKIKGKYYFQSNTLYFNDTDKIDDIAIMKDTSDEKIVNIKIKGKYYSISTTKLYVYGLSAISYGGLQETYVSSIDELSNDNACYVLSDGVASLSEEDADPTTGVIGNGVCLTITGKERLHANTNILPFGKYYALYNRSEEIINSDDDVAHYLLPKVIGSPGSAWTSFCFYHNDNDIVWNTIKPSNGMFSYTRSALVFGNTVYAWKTERDIKHEYGKPYVVYTNAHRAYAHAEHSGSLLYYRGATNLPILVPFPMILKNSNDYTLFSIPDLEERKQEPWKLNHSTSAGNRFLYTDNQPFAAKLATAKHTLGLSRDKSKYNYSNDVCYTGSVILYKTMEHTTGGAYTTIDTTQSVINGQFLGRDLIFGIKSARLGNDRYILDDGQLYSPFNNYNFMSSSDKVYISDDTFSQNISTTFQIGAYTFISGEVVSKVFYNTNEAIQPLYAVRGEIIASPVMSGQSVYFGVKDGTEITLFSITQLSVTPMYRFTSSAKTFKMYAADYIESPVLVCVEDTQLDIIKLSQYSIISCPAIKNVNIEGTDYPITGIKVVNNSYTSLDIDPSFDITAGGLTKRYYINSVENNSYAITSEYIKLPEFKGQSFVLTGIEINGYTDMVFDSSVMLYISDGIGHDYKQVIGTGSLNKISFKLDTPINNPYISYMIECVSYTIKDIQLVGFLTEGND